MRTLSALDRVISELNHSLEIMTGSVQATRPNPAGSNHTDLNPAEAKHAAGLMRVNHVGEVCAQALYKGQAFSTQDPFKKQLFLEAAQEEVDHLAWCASRLKELNSRPSVLNPLWFAGALGLGVVAGKIGDKVSLGFMAETEAQVEAHLDGHLQTLPEQDIRSRQIVQQMKDDEIQHRQTAIKHGGIDLPLPIKLAMKGMAKVMTTTAYHL